MTLVRYSMTLALASHPEVDGWDVDVIAEDYTVPLFSLALEALDTSEFYGRCFSRIFACFLVHQES